MVWFSSYSIEPETENKSLTNHSRKLGNRMGQGPTKIEGENATIPRFSQQRKPPGRLGRRLQTQDIFIDQEAARERKRRRDADVRQDKKPRSQPSLFMDMLYPQLVHNLTTLRGGCLQITNDLQNNKERGSVSN